MISPGRLVFELDGVTHSLDAALETEEKKDLFIILQRSRRAANPPILPAATCTCLCP